MKPAVIEDPILNSPYLEPTRHFRFSDEGITDEIVKSRRVSQYFMPIAPPKNQQPRRLRPLGLLGDHRPVGREEHCAGIREA